MSENQEMATPKASVWKDANNIYHIDYESRVYLDKEDVELQQNAIEHLQNDDSSQFVLVNGTGARGIDVEARQFIQEQNYLGMAIVVKSSISRLVFNFLHETYKPAYPVQLFRKEEDATNWLLSLKK